MKPVLLSVMTAAGLLAAGIPASHAEETVVAAQDQAADNVHAQRRSHSKHRGAMRGAFHNPERMALRMQERLELTDLQRQNVSNVLLAAKPQADALRDASRANKKALRELDTAAADYASRSAALAAERGRLAEDMAGLHAEIRAGIEAELTPEQRAKAAKMLSGRHAGRGKQRNRHDKRIATEDDQRT